MRKQKAEKDVCVVCVEGGVHTTSAFIKHICCSLCYSYIQINCSGGVMSSDRVIPKTINWYLLLLR